MREIRPSGSEGGEAELNRPSLPLSRCRLCPERGVTRKPTAQPWGTKANSTPHKAQRAVARIRW
jgi:hypothetical protein